MIPALVAGAVLLAATGAFAQGGPSADMARPGMAADRLATEGVSVTDPKATDPKTKTDDQRGAPKAPPKQMAKAASHPTALTRWFDFQTATSALRFRYYEANAAKKSVVSQGQSQFNLKGRFKFDRAGRYSVTAAAGTGTSYTGSWDNAGWGTGDRQKTFVVRQLYASAAPVTGVEATWGSFSPWRGESTEITTLDNDGWVSGERVSVKRPKDLFLDEVGVTIAYLGDTATTNVFDRSRGVIKSPNYFQYYASKKLNKFVSASGDVLRWSGVNWMHAGVTAKVPFVVVDTLRYEQYVRGGAKSDTGFAVYGERTLFKKLAAGFGFATVDPNYGGLNADRFNKGNRVYEQVTWKIVPELTFALFATQAVRTSFTVANRYRMDAILTYNVLASFQRAGYFK
jgi:hypothetical protein